MPSVHFHVLKVIIIVLSVRTSCLHCLNTSEVIANVTKLKDPASELTNSYLSWVMPEVSPHCVQMQCKFVCFNGHAINIPADIQKIVEGTGIECERINELRLYNYEFPNSTISRDFLGEFSNLVEVLYIASSNVTDFEAGAFGNGIFEELYFENLQFVEMRKDFFEDITSDFRSLTIIQKNTPLTVIMASFLDYVKYQIKYLSLQVGISCVRNITASDNLLNNLAYVDFSHNDFGDQFTQNTFNKLSMLEHLDLSYSNISYLPEYIFADFTSTLLYLNLSGNKLVTIVRTIFGWRDMPRDLTIYASDNPWNCDCALQTNIKEIFVYQSTILFCESPELYRSLSVLDARICDSGEDSPKEDATLSTEEEINNTETIWTPVFTTSTEGTTKQTTPTFVNPVISSTSTVMAAPTPENEGNSIIILTTTTSTKDNMEVQCNHVESNWQQLKRPALTFSVITEPSLRVAIQIESGDLNDTYGLLWFSKVTTQYYKMETNYNEYGLGCYGAISYTTTVENLLPDMAYTFCLVLKDQLTVSPLSCKSIHVSTNLDISYSAWLTQDMRATGVSVIVLVVIMFTFLGISIVFLILKRNPILIKGSKRVATTNSSKGEIVVFPKDKTQEDFKLREEMLAKRCSRSTISCSNTGRRGSMDSIDSNQSYMNANLYEVIPAYLKLMDGELYSESYMPPAFDDEPDSYMPPLTTNSSAANLVSYAEIPHRSKRISNDPLPEVPPDQDPLSFRLNDCSDRADEVSVYYASTFDSRI